MKTWFIFGFLFITAALFLLAETPNVTGTWDGNMTGESGRKARIQFQLKQTGEQVSGTAGPPGINNPIYDTSLKGDHLTFSTGRDPEPIWRFDLMISGQEMQGTGQGQSEGRSIGTTSVTMSLKDSH